MDEAPRLQCRQDTDRCCCRRATQPTCAAGERRFCRWRTRGAGSIVREGVRAPRVRIRVKRSQQKRRRWAA